MDGHCTQWYQLPQSIAQENVSSDFSNETTCNKTIEQCVPVRYESIVKLSTSDERGEEVHTINSLSLLLICWMLGMTVITIWIFKSKRLRILHETGLSLVYGKVADSVTAAVLASLVCRDNIWCYIHICYRGRGAKKISAVA